MGTIEFRNVNFEYPSRKEKVLKSVNFKIPSGMKVAIVGHSGSGKSTIASLLLKMYEVKSGKILIDNQDIRDYEPKKYKEQIGYVMQEPMLFNTSIKENITYGNPHASI